ncbi:GGDEF domain-containing protein [Nitrincola sp. A-D6]|uniref:GGDEF domain-containing protein n=1 Tax=Nitrincola sp. A-D6 TaxID=1545442 RepID=UPI001362D605|nr:GGDEF domain-containing protein [Nitrincola sp. A-D6]
MSVTLLMVVLGLLLIFTLALTLSLGLLKDISSKTEATAEDYLPELARTQQDALKVEKLGTYLDAAYRVQNAAEERHYRLLSQVIIHSFMLDQDTYLMSEANNIMFDIREMLSVRQLQRELQKQVQAQLNTVDYTDLSYFVGFFSAISVQSIQQQSMQNTLERLQTRMTPDGYESLHYNINFISDLNVQLDWLVADTHQRIENLSSYLSSDAALKARLITRDIAEDALKISNYFLILIALLIFFSAIILFSFQRLILRPVQLLVNGLRAIEGQGEQPITLQPLCFKELDTIRLSIEDYSSLAYRLQKANQELERLSQIDGLTGLANRRCLDQMLDVEVGRSLRYHHPLAVLMIDIDYFKRLNDSYGHQLGDECLQEMARIFQTFTQRPGELAARFGGEEFILIFPEITVEEALRIAESLHAECRKIALLPDKSVSISVSIGIACFQAGVTDSAERLLKHADQALYQAKSTGRNCTRIYG